MTTRTAAAKSLLGFAWALVRYAGYVIRYELSPTAKHLAAEHRWRDECEKRWLAFRLACDQWKAAKLARKWAAYWFIVTYNRFIRATRESVMRVRWEEVQAARRDYLDSRA